MNIYTVSKPRFREILQVNNITQDNIINQTSCFFISINNVGEEPILKENTENLKVLFFDDCTEDCHFPLIPLSEKNMFIIKLLLKSKH